jgi:hypothetical protein
MDQANVNQREWSRIRFALSGLRETLDGANPGLCPGLTNRGLSALPFGVARALKSNADMDQAHVDQLLDPQTISLTEARFGLGPKGRHSPAQGKALGKRATRVGKP